MLRFDPTPFNALNGFAQWMAILGAFILVTLIVSYCVAVATVGLKRAWPEMKMHLGQGIREILFVSPRRVWAIAQLVIRESIRRKALLVFVVFALLFMFGSWFLPTSSERTDMQAVVHITFVLKAITWLTIPVVLLLSCWGLPQDIKQRSLHTVVTKPARRSEVVMGRILGFSAIGTLILGVMAVAGHVWIKRQVPAEAQAELVSRVPVYGELEFTDIQGNPGKGVNTGDVWEFRSYITGKQASAVWTFEDVTSDKMVTITDPDTGKTTDVLQLEYNFEAFRTYKGDMDRGLSALFHFRKDLRTQMAHVFAGIVEFQTTSRLIKEGNFEEAGTELSNKAKAKLKISPSVHDLLITRFRNLNRLMEPFTQEEGFEAASEFVAAAKTAGNAALKQNTDDVVAQLEILGNLMKEHHEILAEKLVDIEAQPHRVFVIEYKRKTKRTETELKLAADQGVNVINMPRVMINNDAGKRQTLAKGKKSEPGKATLDLFKDLTHGGRLRVAVYCTDQNQYIGMARPDLYIRTPDRTFESGYYKAICGTWLMVILVVVLGVTASTFVKGPVATLLTVTMIVVGLAFHTFLEDLVTNLGGKGFGAIESVVRIVEHKNPKTELEESRARDVMQVTDKAILGGLWVIYKTVPNFNVYSLSPYVANGFDVPFDAGLLPALAMTFAYLIPCLFIGYFSLRLRELEAK